MSFDEQSVARIVAIARKDGIDPAALLAVAEVESAGRPLEADGVTPRFLFERHKFYELLKKHAPSKLGRAVNAGLAIAKRSPKTQYKDLGTHSGRMAVLNAARAIDEEMANRSASWGLGQVLGMNAMSLGYDSATAMVAELQAGGVPAQVEAMMRYVRKHRLGIYLNTKDFASFALRYNGPAYADFRYDVKMETAFKKWAAKLDRMAAPAGAEPEPETEAEIEIEELPPPYQEPKTPGKSKSVWTNFLGIITSFFAGIWAWFTNLPPETQMFMIGVFVVLIVFFGFLLRERLKKIAEVHL